MDRKIVIWLVVALALLGATLLTQGVLLNTNNSSAPAEGSPNQVEQERLFDPLWEAYQKTKQNFYKADEIDEKILSEEAVRGMIRGLGDPFSRYNTLEEYENFSRGLEGEYEGIGAYIGLRNGEITIIAPIKGGPAERMGVRAGDVVLEVDGESTQGFTVDDAARRLRGPRDTSVTVKVRHIDGSVEEITIVRERIEIPAVESKLLSPEIAYVRLNTFSGVAPDEMRRALDQLRRESNAIEGLVLDLRSNGGGLLSAAKQIASLFLDRGATILIERRRDGERIHTSYGNNLPNWPIAVLVNEGTASASEIMSGAIRDNDLGVLVGRKTFGKGVIQTTFPMSDGSVLFLTTAEWFTPGDRPIQDVGLAPEFPVEDWFPTLQEVRKELVGLEELLPEFAVASRTVLDQFEDLLDRVETHAGQDEYEEALAALGEFEERMQTDPADLLREAGASEDDPELALMEPLLARLADDLRELLPELRGRLTQSDIAVAVEWLRSMQGQPCPCEISVEAPEPAAEGAPEHP